MTQLTRDEAAAIAAFIRSKGVTRCPTVCAVPTQASVSAADRQLLRQRDAEHEERREERRLHDVAAYRFGRDA
jgi:hypothetical protein